MTETDLHIQHNIQGFYLNLMTYAAQHGVSHEEMAKHIDDYQIDGDDYLEEVKEWTT